jgi:hypothetical protein
MKTTTRIYRIEHRQLGYGPYVAVHLADTSHGDYDEMYDVSVDLNREHSDPTHWPVMKAEPGERIGMSTQGGLRRWFDGWLETLAWVGFVLRVYRVPRTAVRKGLRGQVAFSLADARQIAEQELA